MDKTIDMAREAGKDISPDHGLVDFLKAFEALVRADERERVMNEPLTKAKWQRFEDEIRADERNRTWTQEHWTEYERSIVAAEREACAKVCESRPLGTEYNNSNACATAIRARGNA
jgi:hypothetical protein